MVPKYAKWVVLGLNFAILSFGLSLFFVGAWWLGMEMEYQKASKTVHFPTGALLIALCTLSCITTSLAIYAILFKKDPILDTLNFLSLILFLVYADYGIVAVQLSPFSSLYIKPMYEELEDIFRESQENWETLFDYLHQNLECCGFDGYEDFSKIHNTTHPVSCCSDKSAPCSEPAYKTGCAHPFQKYLAQRFVVSASISFVIAILKISGSIFGYYMKKTDSMERELQEDEL